MTNSLLKILVVDDVQKNLVAMQQILKPLPITPFFCQSGNEALALTLEHSFALVLLDVMMPEMNGFEVAELLRQNEPTKRIPIIFVTALGREETHAFRGYEAGAVDYLLKPVNPQILISKVRVFIDLARYQRELKVREERYRLLVERAPDIIYTFSNQRGGIYYSARVEAILGHSPQHLCNNPWLWNKSIHPDDAAKVQHALQALALASDFDLEYRISDAHGEWVWLHDRLISHRTEGAELIIEGIATDITERKRAENSIRRQNDLLKGINRIFETIVTSASDEEFGTACLAVAENLTGSTISFIGEIGRDGLLHDIAISNPAWQVCDMNDSQGRRKPPGNFHIHGLYESVLSNGTPVLTNAPDAHPDSIGLPSGHPLLTSFLGVPLKQQGKTIGMVAVGNREGGYGAHEKDALESIAPVICEAMARRRAEVALMASLAEKEVLLKEIHHRVKNNMQVISSLVDLQADQIIDETMREVFKDVNFRVRSMALVHEKLYQSTDFSRVDFADYIHSLVSYLWRAQGTALHGVNLKMDLKSVFLPVNEAVPCGLMLNELFTNALKHAFLGREIGEVTISLNSDGQGSVILSVADDGVGLPQEMDIKKARSLGLRLVQMLAGQINAHIEVVTEKGTRFTIQFEREIGK